MGEGLLLGLSWLDGSVSLVLSERKVVKVSSVLRCFSNHVEVNFFYLICVWSSFVFIWSYKVSAFPNIDSYYREYCLFCDEGSGSFFLVLRYIVSGVCLSIYVFVFFLSS
jgi:hypothetical protein